MMLRYLENHHLSLESFPYDLLLVSRFERSADLPILLRDLFWVLTGMRIDS
jgi:hypothetical protein